MKKPETARTIVALLVYSLVASIAVSGLTLSESPAQEVKLPSFGTGKVQVRFYSDYFCPACRALEPKIESMIENLVKKNKVTLTFVDTPIHQHSALYARYFLYTLAGKSDFSSAMAARKVLFEAAVKKLDDPTGLETHLNERAVPFKPFDVRPVFEQMSGLLRHDQINATPTFVIDANGKKDAYQGNDVLQAIRRLNESMSQ